MPYGNNAMSKQIRANRRQYFIKVAMQTRTVADNLSFDLSSYFRVQYLVMFCLKGVPFNLREFVLAAYYLQTTGQMVYNRKLHEICPHIKKTTVGNLLKYDLIIEDGQKSTGRGRKAHTFVVHPYYFNIIERALKDGMATIKDMNYKARQKQKNSMKDAENAPSDLIDFGSIFNELE